MVRYTEEFKEQVVRKMMAPKAMSIAHISRETGVSEQSLYNWRNKNRKEGKAVPADPSNPENWSGENKLAVVIEIAALNEEELSEYCRGKGLYAEQIGRWREAAVNGNEPRGGLSKAERKELKEERKKSRSLEKELKRKEKALAEAAALLILKKKPWQFGGRTGTHDFACRSTRGYSNDRRSS